MKTLAETFAQLRKNRRVTLLETAKKCDLAEATVWKVENGRSIRWETVHLILTVGFNIQPDTKAYNEYHRLWMEDRNRMAESQSPDFGTPQMSPHASRAVRRFRKLVHDLDETECDRLLRNAEETVRRWGS